MKSKSDLTVVDINAVQSRLLTVRDQQVLLDRDVAALYGVETRAVNQAVKNNHGKFPDGYVFRLDGDEFECLKSKKLISNNAHGRGGVRKLPMAFTEKGLYMLASTRFGVSGAPKENVSPSALHLHLILRNGEFETESTYTIYLYQRVWPFEFGVEF